MLMSSDEFLDRLSVLLGVVPDDSHDPYSNLFDDWGLDSLQAFQMIVITESLAEVVVPPPDLPEIYTAGDAYDYYCTLVRGYVS